MELSETDRIILRRLQADARTRLETLAEDRAAGAAVPPYHRHADFALIARARDLEDFQPLTQRLFFNGSNVKCLRPSVVMDRTETGMAVPV